MLCIGYIVHQPLIRRQSIHGAHKPRTQSSVQHKAHTKSHMDRDSERMRKRRRNHHYRQQQQQQRTGTLFVYANE